MNRFELKSSYDFSLVISFYLVKNHNSDNINLSKVLRASQAFSVEESIYESLSKDLETNLRFALVSLASGSISKLRSEIS